ncbi:site-specific integrase [Ruegeria sp. Ofav3-42]|uniref:tyrosine-type recombinase/integrase n=1 Tax=Ruegeria sp. Ofav3-42 TaxID=2917759 RepID=UPI001EF5D58D|nr:site-specific integrase [Ruegeria sp. Ofav3-42]MCG7522770.1 site-specific integrase [Ruegeria sp. Ofav3-42]
MTNPIPLVLLYQDWPQADKTAWEALFAEGDIFDGTGPCASWSEGSRTKRRQSYGYWLSWIKRHQPALLDQSPTGRITKDAVRGFLGEAEARVNAVTLKNMICDLYVLAKAMHPAGDWDWLNKLSNRLIHLADRKSLPKPIPVSASEVLTKSLHWLDATEGDPSHSDLKRAIHFRAGLMIAFLISRPVRRRTLLALTTDQHLLKTSEGFEVYLSAEDTKDKKERWFPLPKVLVQPMVSYLDIHRPALLGSKTSKALWISQYGDPITPDGLSRELPKVATRLLGVELRTHKFRHLAATTIAETDPEHVNIIRDILGHATLDMSQKHYNRATGLSACSDYQSMLQTKMKNLGRKR